MSKENTIISLLKEINKNIDNVGSGGNVPKIKVSSFTVSDACINEDGIWIWDTQIDTSECTSFKNAFNDCTLLKKLTGNWNTSKVTTMDSMFKGCSNLETLDLSSWDVSNVTVLSNTFDMCFNLKYINTNGWDTSKVTNLTATFAGTGIEDLDLSHWNTSSVTIINLMFGKCNKLKHINTYGWDTSNITDTARPFSNASLLESVDFRTWNAGKMTNLTNNANGLFFGLTNLTTFIGGIGINEVITNNVTALNGAKVNIVLSNSTLLDRTSLRALINGLADLTGSDTKTLTLGETLIAKLTEEDIAIATAKNWTIA